MSGISVASRVLILGSSGLIGSACLRLLNMKGYQYVDHPSRATLDLLNAQAVHDYCKSTQPAIIILAAGVVGGIQYNKTYPADFINRNLAIQLNVFQAAKEVHVKKLIFFGSSCMYPRECPQPMTEDRLLTGVPEPTSMSYAISKLAGVQLCHAYNQQYAEGHYIALIPNSTYGINDDFDPHTGHVISAMITKLHHAKCNNLPSITFWGTGAPRREFIYADDVASAVLHVLQQDKVLMPLNIGVGHDWSIKEIAEIISEEIGYTGEIRWDTTKPDGAPRKLLDNSQLISLGWQPSVDIREGLRKTYDWYVNHADILEKETI